MSGHVCYRYIPVLMQQAKIYWDMENYQQVEKIFRKSVEFCYKHDIWKLNVAHVCPCLLQIYSGVDAAGSDLLGYGELSTGGEDSQEVCRVL